jgi:hypothetical protein
MTVRAFINFTTGIQFKTLTQIAETSEFETFKILHVMMAGFTCDRGHNLNAQKSGE